MGNSFQNNFTSVILRNDLPGSQNETEIFLGNDTTFLLKI